MFAKISADTISLSGVSYFFAKLMLYFILGATIVLIIFGPEMAVDFYHRSSDAVFNLLLPYVNN